MPWSRALHRLRLRGHRAWLTAAPGVYAALLVGGFAYFPLSAPYWDDPCCHVQAPGWISVLVGAGGLYMSWRRRREFDALLAGGKASLIHNEKRLRELAKELPASYRARLDAAAEERDVPTRERARRRSKRA